MSTRGTISTISWGRRNSGSSVQSASMPKIDEVPMKVMVSPRTDIRLARQCRGDRDPGLMPKMVENPAEFGYGTVGRFLPVRAQIGLAVKVIPFQPRHVELFYDGEKSALMLLGWIAVGTWLLRDGDRRRAGCSDLVTVRVRAARVLVADIGPLGTGFLGVGRGGGKPFDCGAGRRGGD